LWLAPKRTTKTARNLLFLRSSFGHPSAALCTPSELVAHNPG
jgi:hypothetical protein